ncbi:hypothetical protein JXA88_08485 [Candidatus Fermentibacteria bacterium]|nr:hypothetical protein [Candidatus Fermentibacteria bacterium]
MSALRLLRIALMCLPVCLWCAPVSSQPPPAAHEGVETPYLLRPHGMPLVRGADGAIMITDLDGDERDEIITCRRSGPQTHVLEIRDDTGAHVRGVLSLPASCPLGCTNAFDLDGDGRGEILTSYVAGDTLFFVVTDCHAVLHTTVVVAVRDSLRSSSEVLQPWLPGLKPCAVFDCDHDGDTDIICIGGSGRSGEPRGVWAIDWAERRVLWYAPMGAATSDLKVVAGPLGAPLIVVGTYSAANGVVCNGTDDRHSYLILISEDGLVLQTVTMSSRKYTATRLAMLSTDDGPHLITITACGDLIEPEPAVLRLWNDPIDSVVAWTTTELIDTDPFVADLDADGSDELVLATQRGEVQVYGPDLSLRRRMPFSQGRLTVSAVADFTADGRPDLVVNGGVGSMLVEPRTAEVLAVAVGHNAVAVVRHGREPPTLLTRTSESWVGLRVTGNPAWHRDHTIHLPLGLAGAGALVLFVLGLAVSAVSRRCNGSFCLPGCHTTGMAVIDKSGRVMEANAAFWNMLEVTPESGTSASLDELLAQRGVLQRPATKDLVFRTGAWISLDLDGNPSGDRFMIRASRIPGPRSALIEMRRQSAFPADARRLDWAMIAPRVAHDLKSPVSTLSLAVDRAIRLADEGKPADELFDRILRQVDRIDILSRNFLKAADLEMPAASVIDAGDLLAESVERLRQRVPPGIIVIEKIESPLPWIRGDREQLLSSLENLYENAIAATEGAGTIAVTCYRISALPGSEELVQDGIAVEVQDTGKGIWAGDMPRVFEPGFTTASKGTGLGLALTRMIVTQHGGSIEVHSEPGIGTTFTICLPVGRAMQRGETRV